MIMQLDISCRHTNIRLRTHKGQRANTNKDTKTHVQANPHKVGEGSFEISES